MYYAASGWDRKGDSSVAKGAGYGGSVLVNSGLLGSSFWICQISGSAPQGAWSTPDWLPILVKSGMTLGVLLDARGNLTSELLPLVPFGQWVTSSQLIRAKTTSACDYTAELCVLIGPRGYSDPPIGSIWREAAGFTDFAAEVAQSEQDDGKPGAFLPSDVARWVDYWESVGMFPEACLRRV
ncbi:hypothetical protein BDN67DRAFT_982790 [Paxillus ammoniavirescens]|nr:hypothetical protein BDN67DRAFT_982790 [Paxillus ammoniavirescens]